MQFYRREFIRSALVLFLLAFFLHQPAVFATGQPEASILQGIEAYEDGEYQQALDFFAEAVSMGATGTSLYYNIGVAHYKLAQYAEADAAFIQVAQSPAWESLALYNRALIAYRQNQPERAKELANRSISLSKDLGLSALNYRLIEDINKDLKKSAWSALLLVGTGYNDNVLIADAGASAISGVGDTFFALVSRAQRSMGKLDFLVEASVRDYRELSEYDHTGFRGGIRKALGRSGHTLGAYLEQASLGGKDLHQVASLEYERDFSNVKNAPVRFKYSFDHYTMLNADYAHLGGSRQNIRLARERMRKNGSSEFYVRAEYNDREDQKIMGNFYSFSPARLGIGAVYTRNLGHHWAWSGSLYIQESLFKDPDKRLGVFKTRQDGFTEIRLQLVRVSSSKWLYRTNYIRALNSSNYAEYSYSQNIASVELVKAF